MTILKSLCIMGLTLALNACLSPGYQCPLHDGTRSCLSELKAYQASLRQNQPSESVYQQPLPYVVERIHPFRERSRSFSWRGRLN